MSTQQVATTHYYAPLTSGAVSTDVRPRSDFQDNDVADSVATDGLKYTTPEFSARIKGVDYASIAMNSVVAIILSWQAAGKVSRSYFESANPVAGAKPICFSRNGDLPDSSSPAQQALACSACPQNVAGSAADKKGKACNFKVRLAVVLLEPTPPSTSIMAFHLNAGSAFGDSGLEAQGLYSFYGLMRELKKFPNYVVQDIAVRIVRKPGSQNNMNQLVFQILGAHNLDLSVYKTPEMMAIRQHIVSNDDTRAPRPNPTQAPVAQGFTQPVPTPAPTPAPAAGFSQAAPVQGFGQPAPTPAPAAGFSQAAPVQGFGQPAPAPVPAPAPAPVPAPIEGVVVSRPDPFASGFPQQTGDDAGFGWD